MTDSEKIDRLIGQMHELSVQVSRLTGTVEEKMSQQDKQIASHAKELEHHDVRLRVLEEFKAKTEVSLPQMNRSLDELKVGFSQMERKLMYWSGAAVGGMFVIEILFKILGH